MIPSGALDKEYLLSTRLEVGGHFLIKVMWVIIHVLTSLQKVPESHFLGVTGNTVTFFCPEQKPSDFLILQPR